RDPCPPGRSRVPSLMQRLFVATQGEETHLALCEGDRLVEYAIERRGRPGRIGDIHLGRIARVDRGLGAAFVEIGLERPGFLPLADAEGAPEEGGRTLVQVAREERSGKGARLSGRPRLPGVYLVLAPRGSGVSLSARIDEPEVRRRLTDEVARLAKSGEGWIVRRAAVAAAP